jgi:hypothetical protein
VSRQITTITFFRFDNLKAKYWAFQMMQYAHADLKGLAGQEFYRLMGSGKGEGFNPLPDFSVYSLVQTWKNEETADSFFATAQLIKDYKDRAVETWTLYMRAMRAHGIWGGSNPFEFSTELDPANPLVAVITRATIKTKKLVQFWSFVPTSQKPLAKNDTLIYTKGIGEVPVIQMATFSLWKDMEALKSFAYQSPEHQQAITKTRTLNWYKEELFSRFQPYRSIGKWKGIDQKSIAKINEVSSKKTGC